MVAISLKQEESEPLILPEAIRVINRLLKAIPYNPQDRHAREDAERLLTRYWLTYDRIAEDPDAQVAG